MSLLNARRGVDLIAALVEATVTPYLIHRLRDAMLSSSTGRRILKDRARINSTTVSLEWLRNLPDVTMGREYAAYLDRESVSLDTGSLAKEVINIYWEEELETDVKQPRKRIGLQKSPDLREIRAELRARRKADKAARECVRHWSAAFTIATTS
ncbi:unnamed protein product [Tuber aestivum]|uniref:Uncharacterized protein n=1 Tax=Tuber aestivum TaxID=59557 RepID=A0A292Q832_9PEZI|nr:unnamed protein product [Tuber aestivum]